MTELLVALRALVYMTGFVFVWGWLSLQARSIGRGWVRNPMYLGALLVLIGFGVWLASLAMVLLALPALALAHLFVVFYEEPALRRRFWLPYLAYQARVNRWIPKPPRGGRPSEED